MDDCTVKQSTPAGQPETRLVTIAGSMTIAHGGEIRETLVQALGVAKTLQLNLEQVTEIDIIGLQLICSTHRASIVKGKRLSVVKDNNETIEAAVQAVGFCRRTGCIEDTEHTCVWAGGGK